MSIRYLLGALILFSFTTIYSINEKEVERIISTLSSDKMEGRSLGSEGIKKSADFIANEFKTIGLSKFDGQEGYLQHFNMYSISSKAEQMAVNGNSVDKSNYFVKLSDKRISWTLANKPTILFIGKDEKFRDKAGEVLGGKKNTLVIVDPSHKSMFNRYQSYFSRATLSFDEAKGEGPNIVFILGNFAEIEALSINVNTLVDTQQLANVVGIIEGKRKNEMVLYSGHYDHLGIKESAGEDSIYNGANDDASGVTAVIELARYFKSREQPERTLVFTAFTAEEVGGYGSKYFSKQLNPDEIIAMFNIEMIGKESKKGLNSAWMTGWDKSDLGEILQENLGKVDFTFFEDPYPEQDLFYRSDNATLARLGVPAHSISTTQIDIDQDYHQLSDEVETLDITNITNTIKAIAIGSQGIVDGTQTPTRVDPSTVRD